MTSRRRILTIPYLLASSKRVTGPLPTVAQPLAIATLGGYWRARDPFPAVLNPEIERVDLLAVHVRA